MKRILNKISLLAASIFVGIALLSPASVIASDGSNHSAETGSAKSAICEGVGLTSSQSGCDGESSLDGIIGTVINILSIVVGVISVIMIIIGGLKYITSSGDSNNVNSAKNTILYAVIGLVVVALAQVIVRFVLDKV